MVSYKVGPQSIQNQKCTVKVVITFDAVECHHYLCALWQDIEMKNEIKINFIWLPSILLLT